MSASVSPRQFETLEPRVMLAADFRITEFVASNDNGILDEDGDDSDWLEVANLGDTAGSLNGWYLTDDQTELDQWQIPDVTLQPNEYLVIWASDKDRTDPASELHTNFKLAAGGEYLALVTDGLTVAVEFAPEFPEQYTDISYGLSMTDTGSGIVLGAERYFVEPSPGESNVAASLDSAPFLKDVSHGATQPADNEDIVVTATVFQQGAPVQDVLLHYRVIFGGEVTTPMYDDGAHGDVDAGDGVYGGVIPHQVSDPGEMVRYYVTATDTMSNSSRFPFFSSPDATEYEGTVIADPSVSSALPIHHYFIEDPAWFDNGDGTNNYDESPGVLFYNGELYDNIVLSPKGRTSGQDVTPKFEIALPSDKPFDYSDGVAKPVRKFDIASIYQDPSASRLTLGYGLFAEAGAYASEAFPVHSRVNGDFYRLSIFVERVNGTFLDHNDLDGDGAVYKAEGVYDALGVLYPGADLSTTAGMEKTEGYEADPTFNDLEDFIAGLSPSNPNRQQFLLDNVNLPATISALAVYTITKHYDSATHNYYLYHDVDGTGLWTLLPWDLDLIWERLYEPVYDRYFEGHPFMGGSSYPSWSVDHWNRLYDAIYDSPVTQEMYLRRLRTLMDEYLQPPTTPPAQRLLDNRVDALVATLQPEALMTQQLWGQRTGGSWGTILTLADGVSHLKSKFQDRRAYLYGLGIIPDPQPAQPNVYFGNIDPLPVSGNGDEEYIEIVNPNDFAVDLSGWTLEDAVEYEFPGGSVIPAASVLYVVRDLEAFQDRQTGPGVGLGLYIQGDYKGGLSSAGETLELRDRSGTLVQSLTFGATSVPPEAAPIGIQDVLAGDSFAPIPIGVTDPDTDPANLTYTAYAETFEYLLDQEYNFDAPDTGMYPPYYQNIRGAQEKYLVNNEGIHPTNLYYYLLPDGGLYRFTGDLNSLSADALRGEFIADVGTAAYDNPSLLHAATPSGVDVTFDFAGVDPAQMTVTPPGGFVGQFPVTVVVQDGNVSGHVKFTTAVLDPGSVSPDFDTDGDVDLFDLMAWQRGHGTHEGATQADGDATADGDVDATDLAAWRAHFGTPAAVSLEPNSVVAAADVTAPPALSAAIALATDADPVHAALMSEWQPAPPGADGLVLDTPLPAVLPLDAAFAGPVVGPLPGSSSPSPLDSALDGDGSQEDWLADELAAQLGGDFTSV